jgi:hypothetical protein
VKRGKILLIPGLAISLLALWIAVDLQRPTRRDLRVFHAPKVARLETEMWRSYYDHRRVDLFFQLADLMSQQYGMPFWRARLAAFYAAKAAVVFQRGKQRTDYLQALPDLERYYRLVAQSAATSFDVPRVAALELEWWIVHRERDRHPAGDLEHSLAVLQAAIYPQTPAAAFAEHAKARAEAMLLRDRLAASIPAGVKDSDWRTIEGLLDRSWRSLHAAVQ